jgi:hypothetical protein
LVYGTNEWRQALVESNAEVVKLLNTYPQLSRYLSRGQDNQLIIADEGWNEVIKQQEEGIRNATSLQLASQLDELNL